MIVLLLLIFTYLVLSVTAFVATLYRRGKTGKDRWYDYIWFPGAMFVAVMIGYTTHIIEKLKNKPPKHKR